MTAYLKWEGMTEAKLSLYREARAVSGLAAIVIVSRLLNRSGRYWVLAALLEARRPMRGICGFRVLACFACARPNFDLTHRACKISLSLDSWNSIFFEILVDGATLADWLLQIFHFLPMPLLNRIMYHRFGVLWQAETSSSVTKSADCKAVTCRCCFQEKTTKGASGARRQMLFVVHHKSEVW